MSKPVYGSATAEMSLSSRLVAHAALAQPGAPCCQAGALNSVLHPLPVALNCLKWLPEGGPLSFHTASLLRVPFALSLSEVPPTATTLGSDAGAFGVPGGSIRWAMKSQSR